MKATGEIIKEIRKSLRLSQTDFANSLNFSRSYIAQLESNNTLPSFEFVNSLYKVYKIEPNFVFNIVNNVWNESNDNNSIIDFNKINIETLNIIVEIINRDILLPNEKKALINILDSAKQDLLKITYKIDNIDK
ncbi:helix-turn-helix transcriptional regulator [Empedobacter sp. GD03739]|uniref:helix-turn-helix domain-containing protein n=1 Tax=Empedobacter sp. GD03739 TaxID=2975376 RepID=UPI002446F25F|nr:helix-turn-helix transcriptional regulator [Empedobacter sp. GD03739]MDH1602240.1 helix-turn-helix domain-containing protein [Empedobacter sp. GD03739]